MALIFSSDDSNSYEGTYLDEITIWKRTGDAAPAITSLSRDSAAAGIGQTVTINGRGFGAAKGAGSVRFYHVGSTWAISTASSWSDTKIVCSVPVPASSNSTQAIKVTTDGGLVAYSGFAIKWSYHGWKWPGSPSQARYYVYQNTADCADESLAIRNAAHSWNNVDFHDHALTYYGATTRSAPARDNYNVLRWGSTDGSIATCTTWFSIGDIVEFDVVFDDSYNWSTSSPVPAGRMDVQNIATHELGHGGVGFYDLYGAADAQKTMYGYSSTAERIKRSLHPYDIEGIRWIY